MYYSKTGVEVEISNASGAFYRSVLMTLDLPTGMTSAYNANILHASVNVSHNNYPVFGTLASVAVGKVNYYDLSGNTRGKNLNYIVSAYVFGVLTDKA